VRCAIRSVARVSAVRRTEKPRAHTLRAGLGGAGDFNFHGVGHSFAVWTDFSAAPKRPNVSTGSPHPTLLFNEDEPGFGSAAAIDGDELFAFGCVRDGLTFHCLLAKVQLDAVFDRSAWLFWDGGEWSKSLTSARPVFDASAIVSVQFNAYAGHWMAGRLGLEGARAPTPTGSNPLSLRL
jgi:hypothetical protein